MLHAPPQAVNDHHQIAISEPERESALELSQILAILGRQWLVIVVFTLVSLVLATAYLVVTPPRYTASAALMLDPQRLQLFKQQSVLSDVTFDAPAVEGQLDVLRSKAIAASVINNLELLEDAEFTADATSFFGSIRGALTGMFGASHDEEVLDTKDELMARALGRFLANLTVTRAPRSFVITIGFRSLDQEKAARIANAVGEAYILHQLQSKYTMTKRATVWLQERIAELREDAVKADRVALEFRNKHNLVDAGGGRLLSEQQLTEVNTQLILARTRTAEAKARYDRILEVNDRGVSDAPLVDALQYPALTKLQQQYVEAARREAELSGRHGADHPAAVNLRKEMETIRRVSGAEITRIAETLKGEYDIARSREEALLATLNELTRESAGTREAQVGLRGLESSANAYRTLHDNYLQRFVEATQQQSFLYTEARVIDEAAGADKTHPNTLLVLGLAGMLGFGLGSGAAFVRDGRSHVVRTARQIEQTLGIECIGIVPAVENNRAKAGSVRHAQLSGAEPQVTGAELGIDRHVVRAPFSRFAETIRSIKVTADTSSRSRDIKVIGMVSAIPGEGKSTIAANFAQLVALSGRRALLIDGDLRNPSLTRRMAVKAGVGLIEVLDGKTVLSKAVCRDEVTGLDFLPTVLSEPIAHTSEIVASDGMGKLLEAARDVYDYIVVDCPPLAPVVDVKAAAHLIDAFVLVVAWGETSTQVIRESLESAEVVQAKLLGAVLNRANPSSLKKLEAYKGGNYHRYYSSHMADL